MARYHLAAAAFGAIAGMSLPAWSQEIWNFNGPQGALGTSATFLSSPSSIATVVSGFTTAGVAVTLFQKNAGGTEVGLGLTDDPSGLNEDTSGNFIQLSLNNLSAGQLLDLSIGTNSSSLDQAGNPEMWGIAFSNTSGVLGTIIDTGMGNTIITGLNSGGAKFIDVTDTSSGPGNGILVAEMDAPSNVVGVTEPATYALLCSGLLGLIAVRRRRQS